ncbi:MAG: hypothetical protein ACRDFS_03105, partial [Chloroflexota bacterium]
FITELTAHLGGRPALMQEFGLPTGPAGTSSHYIEDCFLGHMEPQFIAGEYDAAAYYQAVLDRLWLGSALGAIVWMYADYSPLLWNKPPLNTAVRERTFGIFHSDLSPKPAAEVIRRFSAEITSGAIESRLGGRGTVHVAFTKSADQYYRDPPRSYAESYVHYLECNGLRTSGGGSSGP